MGSTRWRSRVAGAGMKSMTVGFLMDCVKHRCRDPRRLRAATNIYEIETVPSIPICDSGYGLVCYKQVVESTEYCFRARGTEAVARQRGVAIGHLEDRENEQVGPRPYLLIPNHNIW